MNNTNTHERPLLGEIIYLLLLAAIVFLTLAFISFDPYDLPFFSTEPNNPAINYCGRAGAWAVFFGTFLYGFSIITLPVFVISLLFRRYKGMESWDYLYWAFYLQLNLFFLSVLMSVLEPVYLSPYVEKFQIISSGGILGLVMGKEMLLIWLGRAGTILLSAIMIFISLQGVIKFSYISCFHYLIISLKKLFQWGYAAARFLSRSLRYIITGLISLVEIIRKNSDEQEDFHSEEEEPEPVAVPSPSEDIQEQEDSDEMLPEAIKKLKKKTEDQVKARKTALKTKSISRKRSGNWKFPALTLLNTNSGQDLDLEEKIEANARHLEQTFMEFGIECSVVNIECGPVITRYEIQIASGIKVQKVTSLDNDISLAMRAKSVRIIAPIPGKNAIGIEIPNQIRKTVFMHDLLTSGDFRKNKSSIPMVLGKDISGKTVIADLAKMPHLLIAGATGAGKSVCINTIITSFLYTLSPDELKIMMVDPKKVELAGYAKIPHLFVPLITNPNKVAHGLKSLIDEMDRRYQLFRELGVRNIFSYNQKDKKEFRAELALKDELIDLMEEVPEKLPFIVVIIDELADLMMVARAEVENAIVRLAQLSRAVGIHLILATQRPSVDVVTGLIKANVPSRVAFRVASSVDSRTVLDGKGAEKLLGRGDMLFLNPGDIELKRLQGAFLEDDEIERVVQCWEEQAEPVFDQRAMNYLQNPENDNISDSEEKDPLFDEAVVAVRESKQASTSFLQKRFRIGYNRASRLIDDLESQGIVGPAMTGGKTRDVYFDDE